MKFIDLFAGLGGFHVALENLGHECVFASEIKESLANLYEQNFGLEPARDIRKVKTENIPAHDILCAGFPCQPFSKAGKQKGFNDEDNGDLFNEIVRILKIHRPQYFILENVHHLANHDDEETFAKMYSVLNGKLGYSVKKEILSPHEFNIPQHRQRLFIVGSKTSLDHFVWPSKVALTKNVFDFLEPSLSEVIKLEKEKSKCLEVWQEFLDAIPKEDKFPSFPIWAMEFGASYPFENSTPFASSNVALGKTTGNFGVPLKGMDREEKFLNLPSYARTEEKNFPTWKKLYIRSNRAFYEKHKKRIIPVIKKIKQLNIPSWQKFEWNIQGGEREIKKHIIQFRASGIRLKKTDFFPSLVCVSTQIPIIGWENRYITKWEGARLQGLSSLEFLPVNNGSCFDALGNAVNSKVVKLIAEKLLNKNHKANNLNNVAKQHSQKLSILQYETAK